MSAREPGTSYARVTHQYLPAAVMVVVLAIGVSAARRALVPEVDGMLGDLLGAVALAAIAITLIGVLIVRPFEHRMHERRRVSATRERAYRMETERREFERRVASGLELCDDEADLVETTCRAMAEATAGAPSELLLAGPSGQFGRVAVAGAEAPACQVASPTECPATRRGAAQCFEDSASLDACPWLRGRRETGVAAVCVPVSVTGRALGVLHAVYAADTEVAAAIEPLSALAEYVGTRISVLRLTAAAAGAAAEPSVLVAGAPVGGATADGRPHERGAVAWAGAPGDARGHEISGVGAAATPESAQRVADGAVEHALLDGVE